MKNKIQSKAYLWSAIYYYRDRYNQHLDLNETISEDKKRVVLNLVLNNISIYKADTPIESKAAAYNDCLRSIICIGMTTLFKDELTKNKS